MRILCILFLLVGNILLAQKTSIPRDTSFTIYSAYQKEKLKYPDITIADPEVSKDVAFEKDIVFRTVGDRRLLLDIYYPLDTHQKHPGVLIIFGGGWKSGDKSMSVPLAKALSARGFVAVAVEYRLSPEAQYPAAVHDLKEAVRWMRANAKRYNLDESKIASMGTSAGGQLAALLGTTNENKKLEGKGGNMKYSSSIQAIVDIDGVLAFKHPESAEGKVAGEWLGGTYEEKPENWEEASALNHVDKKTPPTLFIASQFPRFQAGKADMIKKMDSLGIYSEVHTFPETPHPFWLFHPWFEPTVDYTVQFLNKVLRR
jgi:acetyl esterase/lipase